MLVVERNCNKDRRLPVEKASLQICDVISVMLMMSRVLGRFLDVALLVAIIERRS